MSYLGEFEISSAVPFNFQALDGFGEATDADQAPTYEVYVNNSPMDPAVTGILATIDGQTGFYGGSVAATAANGFAAGNTYTIRISAVIAGVVTLTTHTFRLLANAATTVSATFTRPALEDNQVPVEADNPHDAALISMSKAAKATFGRPIVVLPDGVTERKIVAIVKYDEVGPVSGLGHGKSQIVTIKVDNNAVTGLSTAEFDRGKALARVPEAIGKTPVTKRITKILRQNVAMVTYQVQ